MGQNLHDPIQVFVEYAIDVPSAQTLVANPALQPTYLAQYLENGSGPYSSAAGYLAFERIPASYLATLSNTTRSKLAAFPSDWPEISYIGGSFVGANLTTTGTISAVLPLPFSRGNVSIRTARMTDPPVLSLNWLDDPADRELALVALKRLRRDIWDTSTAAEVTRGGPELVPGPSVVSDQDMEAYIRAGAYPIWHACGTCAMGQAPQAQAQAPAGDGVHGTVSAVAAVVDSRAKVFGVEALRVVDASVFPFALPVHPQAGVYALAEKIAADILLGGG